MKFHTVSLTLLISAASAHAASVANWQVMAAGAGLVSSTSGLDTASPVFGDGTAEDMDGVGIAGLFGTTATPASVTLAVGETLTVTAEVTLTGGLSSSAGAAYRFSLQNDGGQFDVPSADNWGGGWNHILITGNTAGDGFYQARTDGNYMSNAGDAVKLADAPTPAPSGTFDADSATNYLWTMSVTRNLDDTLDLFSSFSGGPSSFLEEYTFTDVASSLYTYNAVGIQVTGGSDLDQLTLANVQYSVIPEPSTALLGGLGLLALLRRRRC